MNELEHTPGRVLQIWWAITWRTFAIVFPIVLVVSLIAFFALRPESFETRTWISRIVSVVFGIPGGIVALAGALKASYSGFRLALIPTDQPKL